MEDLKDTLLTVFDISRDQAAQRMEKAEADGDRHLYVKAKEEYRLWAETAEEVRQVIFADRCF